MTIRRTLSTTSRPVFIDRGGFNRLKPLVKTAPGFDRPTLTYEGCSNMNASSFITFFTYMLRQNGKRFYKGLYVTFKLALDLNKNKVYFSSYSPLNEGHVSILTNSTL